MAEYIYSLGKELKIGYKPENKARIIRLDISAFRQRWPNATPVMLVQRCGEDNTYIADTYVEDDTIVWTVSRYDVEKVGKGTMWVAFFGKDEDDMLALSKPTDVLVMQGPPDVDGIAPPPTAIPWVERVIKAAQDILEHGNIGDIVTKEDLENAVSDYMAKNPISFTESDPTVSDWAKQKNKPSYTAKEVGAADATETTKALESLSTRMEELQQSMDDQTSCVHIGTLPPEDNSDAQLWIDTSGHANTIDSTLSKQGAAADAKATGDAIKALQETKSAYYTPEVSADGNLTWMPSKEGMPEIPSSNIVGPQGPAGSDANVTSSNIVNALGYTPASEEDVDSLFEDKVNSRSTAEQESAPLGEELASASGWTTDGWTGSFADGFKHTDGNTNPLIFTMPEATGTNAYQISFMLDPEVTVEAETAKGIWVSLGGSEYFDLYGQSNPYAVGIKSVSDGNLQFNVGTNYTGTISNISVKRILGSYEAPAVFRDSAGGNAVEIRPTTENGRNLFIGIKSGEMVTTGHANVGLGADALRSNTSGYRNIGIGSYAMESMGVGSRNAAIGHTAMRHLVDGQRNTAIGNCALTYLRHGHRNVAIGADSMFTPTECSDNVAIGKAAMYMDGQGDENVAIGNYSMYKNKGKRNVAIGMEAQYNNADDGNIAIGYRAAYVKKAGSGNVVIGYQADSLGAKQSTQAGNVIIGNSAGAYLGDNCNSNVIIGRQAGQQLKSGSGNILIGGYVNAPSETSTSWINIGNLYQGSRESGKMYASIRGGLEVTELPTSDPGIAGRFWNDGGTVKVSAG